MTKMMTNRRIIGNEDPRSVFEMAQSLRLMKRELASLRRVVEETHGMVERLSSMGRRQFNTAEAAAYLGVTQCMVRKLLHHGLLEAGWNAAHTRRIYTIEQLDAYQNSRRYIHPAPDQGDIGHPLAKVNRMDTITRNRKPAPRWNEQDGSV